jgi:hypothetical protein
MTRDFLITVDLPEWARWYAMDDGGEWHCYECKPRLDTDGLNLWVAMGEMQFMFEYDRPGIDWTKTLHEIGRAA